MVGAMSVDYPNVEHGLFQLLKLLFPDDVSADWDEEAVYEDTRQRVVQCLRPEGYTRDALDMRSSYFLLVLLECADISSTNRQSSSNNNSGSSNDSNNSVSSNNSSSSSPVHALVVRQQFIYQLVSAGLWHWAVFVALQIPDTNTRTDLAKELVLRYFEPETNEDEEDQPVHRSGNL